VASVFAWLDSDDTQQQKMRQLIELFKDESTVDELGIGTIRDTIANELFPGTSVLQTRVRYLLFIPWLVRDVASHHYPSDVALTRLRSQEVRLIDSLLAGGETGGVIGRQAKAKLKSMPSNAYWAGLHRFGIRTWDLSIAEHYRAVAGHLANLAKEPGDDSQSGPDLGLDPALPAMPEDLLLAAGFSLTPDEATYLQSRIAQACPRSLLAWLALEGQPSDYEHIWEHEQLKSFPPEHQLLLDHGRRFHHAIHGAALIYNLLLAEKRDDTELIDGYRDELEVWRSDLAASEVFDGWVSSDFWTTLANLNPRIHPATKSFVDRWLELVREGDDLTDDETARRLITARERKLKGGRARLANAAALDVWTGGSGLVRLDYRWSVARRHLNDIYAGLEVS
jgi:hypothetical protein